MKMVIVVAALLHFAAVCFAAEQVPAALRVATNDMPAKASVATNAVPTKKKASAQQRPQCAATTLSGGRCRRRAAVGSIYCRQHEAIMRRRQEQGQ